MSFILIKKKKNFLNFILVDWCPEPPSVHGGKVEVSGRRAGSVATYTCQSGFILFGSPVNKFSREKKIFTLKNSKTKKKNFFFAPHI